MIMAGTTIDTTQLVGVPASSGIQVPRVMTEVGPLPAAIAARISYNKEYATETIRAPQTKYIIGLNAGVSGGTPDYFAREVSKAEYDAAPSAGSRLSWGRWHGSAIKEIQNIPGEYKEVLTKSTPIIPDIKLESMYKGTTSSRLSETSPGTFKMTEEGLVSTAQAKQIDQAKEAQMEAYFKELGIPRGKSASYYLSLASMPGWEAVKNEKGEIISVRQKPEQYVSEREAGIPRMSTYIPKEIIFKEGKPLKEITRAIHQTDSSGRYRAYSPYETDITEFSPAGTIAKYTKFGPTMSKSERYSDINAIQEVVYGPGGLPVSGVSKSFIYGGRETETRQADYLRGIMSTTPGAYAGMPSRAIRETVQPQSGTQQTALQRNWDVIPVKLKQELAKANVYGAVLGSQAPGQKSLVTAVQVPEYTTKYTKTPIVSDLKYYPVWEVPTVYQQRTPGMQQAYAAEMAGKTTANFGEGVGGEIRTRNISGQVEMRPSKDYELWMSGAREQLLANKKIQQEQAASLKKYNESWDRQLFPTEPLVLSNGKVAKPTQKQQQVNNFFMAKQNREKQEYKSELKDYLIGLQKSSKQKKNIIPGTKLPNMFYGGL